MAKSVFLEEQYRTLSTYSEEELEKMAQDCGTRVVSQARDIKVYEQMKKEGTYWNEQAEEVLKEKRAKQKLDASIYYYHKNKSQIDRIVAMRDKFTGIASKAGELRQKRNQLRSVVRKLTKEIKAGQENELGEVSQNVYEELSRLKEELHELNTQLKQADRAKTIVSKCNLAYRCLMLGKSWDDIKMAEARMDGRYTRADDEAVQQPTTQSQQHSETIPEQNTQSETEPTPEQITQTEPIQQNEVSAETQELPTSSVTTIDQQEPIQVESTEIDPIGVIQPEELEQIEQEESQPTAMTTEKTGFFARIINWFKKVFSRNKQTTDKQEEQEQPTEQNENTKKEEVEQEAREYQQHVHERGYVPYQQYKTPQPRHMRVTQEQIEQQQLKKDEVEQEARQFQQYVHQNGYVPYQQFKQQSEQNQPQAQPQPQPQSQAQPEARKTFIDELRAYAEAEPSGRKSNARKNRDEKDGEER